MSFKTDPTQRLLSVKNYVIRHMFLPGGKKLKEEQKKSLGRDSDGNWREYYDLDNDDNLDKNELVITYIKHPVEDESINGYTNYLHALRFEIDDKRAYIHHTNPSPEACCANHGSDTPDPNITSIYNDHYWGCKEFTGFGGWTGTIRNSGEFATKDNNELLKEYGSLHYYLSESFESPRSKAHFFGRDIATWLTPLRA